MRIFTQDDDDKIISPAEKILAILVRRNNFVIVVLRKYSHDSFSGFLSLFSIVNFKNDPCVAASDSSMKGTCYTTSECSSLGGSRDGNCASGFGVCCLFFFTCSSSTNVNRVMQKRESLSNRSALKNVFSLCRIAPIFR